MIRRIRRTRRDSWVPPANNAAAVLLRNFNHMTAAERARYLYLSEGGSIFDSCLDAEERIEAVDGVNGYVQEARGGIEEDWLADELADLQSIADQMRPKKTNPLRDKLREVIAKIEEKRDEEVRSVEFRTEQLDLLDKALNNLNP